MAPTDRLEPPWEPTEERLQPPPAPTATSPTFTCGDDPFAASATRLSGDRIRAPRKRMLSMHIEIYLNLAGRDSITSESQGKR